MLHAHTQGLIPKCYSIFRITMNYPTKNTLADVTTKLVCLALLSPLARFIVRSSSTYFSRPLVRKSYGSYSAES